VRVDPGKWINISGLKDLLSSQKKGRGEKERKVPPKEGEGDRENRQEKRPTAFQSFKSNLFKRKT